MNVALPREGRPFTIKSRSTEGEMGGGQQNQNRLHKGVHFFRELTLLKIYFCLTQYLEDGRTTIFEFASHKKNLLLSYLPAFSLTRSRDWNWAQEQTVLIYIWNLKVPHCQSLGLSGFKTGHRGKQ